VNLSVGKGEILLLYLWIVFNREKVSIVESKLNLKYGKDPDEIDKNATLKISEMKL
jgi:hypothetical protein